MKFKFVFEKLLDYKHSLEKVAKREWLEAQALVDAAMKDLNTFYAQVDDARVRASNATREGGAQGPTLISLGDFIVGQKTRIEQQRLKIRELMMVAEEKHELLVAAAKERRTLEKLKEHRLDEYRLLRKKHEAKKMDEIVVTRFKRTDEVA